MQKLENIPQAASLVLMLTLACAISYNYGYFLHVNLSLIGALSIQDHISMGITYIPTVIITLLFLVVYAYSQTIILDRHTIQSTDEKLGIPRRIAWIIAATIMVAAYLFGDRYHLIFYSIPAIFLLYLTFDRMREVTGWSRRSIVNLTLAIATLLIFLTVGNLNAHNDSRATGKNFRLLVDEGSAISTLDVSALQAYQDNILYFVDGEPFLLSMKKVTSIQDLRSKERRSGRGFCESGSRCVWPIQWINLKSNDMKIE